MRRDIDTLAGGSEVLHDRQTAILLARLSPQEQVPLQPLGQNFGISRERVRQIEMRAIRKLLHPARLPRSRVAAALRLLTEDHHEDLDSQARWLMQELLAGDCSSGFRTHIIETFFHLTRFPPQRRREILASLPALSRQLRREAQREARRTPDQEKALAGRKQADAFVLAILAEATYGGSHLAEFPDLSNFAPLRDCQGQREEFSQTLQRLVRVESQGEALLVRALDTCGIVDAFAEQAIRIPYTLDGIQRDYIPDLLVRTVEGLAYVIEVKARPQLADRTVQIKARAAEAFLGRHGIGYCLVDATGTSVTDLRGLAVGDELRSFVHRRLNRSGQLRLRDLRDHLGAWPGDEMLDQIQSMVLAEGLDYRTRIFPVVSSRTGYGFNFTLRILARRST